VDRYEYQYDEIILGGNLAALMTAYYEGIPVFWEKPERPLFFDKTEEGESKLDLWESYAFLLSMGGLCPFADKTERIEIKENKSIRVYGKGPFYVDVKYNKIRRFDEVKKEKYYQVIDWVDVRRGMIHDVDLIETDDRFVNEVRFYQSPRIDGNHNKKDLCTISYLTEEELHDIDYSELYIRLKTEELMKENGIKGRGHGFYRNGTNRFLSIKLEPTIREVRTVNPEQEAELVKKYRTKFPKLESMDRMAATLGEPLGT
jgi:hypothetical protein